MADDRKRKEGRRANGEGSLTQLPSGSWQYRVSLGKDPITGKYIRRNIIEKTKDLAVKKANKLKHEYDLGIAVVQVDMTVALYSELWLKVKALEVKPSTFANYRYDLQRYINPHIGNVALANLHPKDVKELQVKLNGLYGPYMANRVVKRALSIMLNDATLDGYINTNPVTPVRSLKYQRKDKKILRDGDEIRRFLEVARTETRLFALFFVALATGLRPGELLALKWDDITFFEEQDEVDAGEIEVAKSLVHIRGRPTQELSPKTENSRRAVGFARDVKEVLLEHREELIAESTLPGYQKSGLVFPTSRGTHLNLSNVKRALDRVTEKAQVERVTFHGLRHTHVSLLVASNYDPAAVARRVGHRSPGFTLSTYAKFFEKKSRPKMRDLEDLL